MVYFKGEKDILATSFQTKAVLLVPWLRDKQVFHYFQTLHVVPYHS